MILKWYELSNVFHNMVGFDDDTSIALIFPSCLKRINEMSWIN